MIGTADPVGISSMLKIIWTQNLVISFPRLEKKRKRKTWSFNRLPGHITQNTVLSSGFRHSKPLCTKIIT